MPLAAPNADEIAAGIFSRPPALAEFSFSISANPTSSLETNPRLQTAFLEVVENQLRDNDPPETSETLQRLMSEGISERDARLYIAQAICTEVWDMLKNGKEFDRKRYIRNLRKLPAEPAV